MLTYCGLDVQTGPDARSEIRPQRTAVCGPIEMPGGPCPSECQPGAGRKLPPG
jgi:hypothetical protein